MATALSKTRRLDSTRSRRFIEIYQSCLEAGQGHDDLAKVCGLTPGNLRNVVEAGGATTEDVLVRLEKWAMLCKIPLPDREPSLRTHPRREVLDALQNGKGANGKIEDTDVIQTKRKQPSRLSEAKASKHQHDEFHVIVRELKEKYRLSLSERLRAAGYRSLTGLNYALVHGPKLWVYERTRFIRNALLAGTMSREEAFAEADRRWPVPETGVRARRRRKTAAARNAVQDDAPNQPVNPTASAASRNRSGFSLPELAADTNERLIRGFSVIERCGLELARIAELLIELATDPGMPRTVRKTAGEMANGLTKQVLPHIELEDAPPPGE